MAEWLALPTLEHEDPGSIPTGSRIQLMTVCCFIAFAKATHILSAKYLSKYFYLSSEKVSTLKRKNLLPENTTFLKGLVCRKANIKSQKLPRL